MARRSTSLESTFKNAKANQRVYLFSGQNKELVEEHTCAICYDVYDPPIMKTPCGHFYCKKCICTKGGKLISAIKSCPLCRQPLRSRDIKRCKDKEDESYKLNKVKCRTPGCEWEGNL